METALVSLVCVTVLIVGMVTLTFNAFEAATTVSDSLREMEANASEIRLTEIEASQWGHNVYIVAYQGDNGSGYLKTVAIASNGLITKAAIDTLLFDTTCVQPNMVHVSGDVYALVYEGSANDGFVTTVEIATDGQITDTVIDTLEYETGAGYGPEIVRVSGDVYAIAYRGVDDDGFLRTVEIATNGQITDAVMDTLEFDTFYADSPCLAHVTGNTYAIAYTGADNDGYLKTVEIAASGQITDAVIDTLEFDTADGGTPHIVEVTDTVHAIIYRGYHNDGYLKTVEIAAGGQITDAIIDTLEFAVEYGFTPAMTHVWGNIFGIAHQGVGVDGFLDTVEIADDGQITDAVMDTLEFDTDNAESPTIINASGGFFCIAYMGPDGDGFLKIAEIDTNGRITDTVIDTFEFDTSHGENPQMIETLGGSNSVSLRVVNRGQSNLAEYAKWDIITQYEDGTVNYISYTTEPSPGSNQWVVEGLYMLDGNPEVYDPDILNPGEQMKLIMNLDPAIGLRETVRITVSTPNGVKSQCLVTRD